VKAETQNLIRQRRVFDCQVRVRLKLDRSLVKDRSTLVVERRLASPKQAVTHCKVQLPLVSLLIQLLDAACLHSSDEEPEAGNRDCERVDVHAEKAVESVLGSNDLIIDTPFRFHPLAEQSIKRTEEKVA
jgi:hypothetical protein